MRQGPVILSASRMYDAIRLAVGPGRVEVAIAGPAGIPGVSAMIVTVATGEEQARQAG